MPDDERRLQLWGGLESTIARIGDRFRDQTAETGHRGRLDDLDRIAQLGIRTLRYPVLWETLQPEGSGRPDWSWHDERLLRLRELGIQPIAGLIHHGSGPSYTNLLDPDFPRHFARHAARVAKRYPWIELYTPVNEPLTTARFSALYGHWYPHERSYGAFLRALISQVKATVLAMREIRKVNPAAKLVQTDDFGKTFSTPLLAYQAYHENERRWLTFDLLFGLVGREHEWWKTFQENGISARELAWIRDNATPPDIVGINHYLTSERFLDERLGRYPEHLWGANGWGQRYADVEAVRMHDPGGEVGPAARLREVWERYRAPVAVTEVHHGCTRDEQLRWLAEVWQAAETVKGEGADIRAVTIWSLFGTVDWNTLLTRENGIYEPGAFDTRSAPPRPTALAHAARSLAVSGRFDHPVLDRPGWWRRETRFYTPLHQTGVVRSSEQPRSLLIIGDEDPLTAAFARIATMRGLDHLRIPRRDLERVKAAKGVWAVLDLQRPSKRETGNDGPGSFASVAAFCAQSGIAYLTVSSAGMFGGDLGRPHVESDEPSPVDEAGRWAAAHERRVRQLCPDALAIRTGPLFGPWDRDSFAFRLLADLAAGQTRGLSGDVLSPTYLPDLVHVTLDLLIDGDRGIRHLVNPGALSAAALARELAPRAGLDAGHLPHAEPGLCLALSTERDQLMPPLHSALDRFVRDCEPDWRIPDGVFRVAAE